MQEHAAPGGSKLAPRFLIAGLVSQGDQSGGHGRRLGYPPNPLHYTDHQDHQQVWRALHLTALNTWIRPQHGQVATFMFEGTEHQPQSQIDFVIIRSHHCATRSKQAGIIESFPGAAWRSGAKHFPVRAEVPLPRPQWTHRPAAEKPVQIDQERLIQDLRSTEPSTIAGVTG